ncbi:hypothetical protein DFH07DRAFT_1056778 [Mycena maculata]|uniref:Uncharacterized protein n=1 Tax=Mycena maculata TaxID=230809 RepID=A0AAD7K2L5_9AGAR|nr:hypothetical protein DFH07DRAFT_1056778 [Mycena maculata]
MSRNHRAGRQSLGSTRVTRHVDLREPAPSIRPMHRTHASCIRTDAADPRAPFRVPLISRKRARAPQARTNSARTTCARSAFRAHPSLGPLSFAPTRGDSARESALHGAPPRSTLTPDADEEFTELTPDETYLIGGINEHLEKAQALGMRMARFSGIYKYMRKAYPRATDLTLVCVRPAMGEMAPVCLYALSHYP